jgi:copper chaperone CopZ
MKYENVTLHGATWKLQNVRTEEDLDRIAKVLHNAPGIIGCEISKDRLEVTFEPDRFTESNLKELIQKAGAYQLLARIETSRRLLPLRASAESIR